MDTNYTFTVRELGGILRQWVSKPGYSSKMVGNLPMSREDAITAYEQLLAYDEHLNAICAELAAEYPGRQIYVDYIDGKQGRHAFVYALRRKKGVYPIEKAIKV